MEKIKDVFLYGASGHAKVVMDMAKLANYNVPSLIDDNLSINTLSGVPVVHSADGLSTIIVTIGDCQIRRKIVHRLGDREFITLVHPSAIVAESAQIDCGTVVMAGAILQPDVQVGKHCIINTGAVVDHETKIGDFVHIAPHCTLSGDVHVGEGTWIGVGATVIQGIHIGKNCFIGAGAVVVKDIPDDTLCYGNPARVIRKIIE